MSTRTAGTGSVAAVDEQPLTMPEREEMAKRPR